MPDFTITDFADREIKTGTTVRIWCDPAFVSPRDNIFGIVTDLGEWEGDVDDEGRSIGIRPHVTVQWEDGTTDSFITSEWEYGYRDDYFPEPVSGKVEELDVVEGPLRKEIEWTTNSPTGERQK